MPKTTSEQNLENSIEDKAFDKKKATALLKQFAGVHAHSVKKKARIMVDHFREKVEPTLEGKAKAMIVTRSRLHAVRYAIAVREYLKEQGEPFEALVAFTGTVKDEDTGGEYTEAKMNGFSEDKLRLRFEAAHRKILIVASKYQTGRSSGRIRSLSNSLPPDRNRLSACHSKSLPRTYCTNSLTRTSSSTRRSRTTRRFPRNSLTGCSSDTIARRSPDHQS